MHTKEYTIVLGFDKDSLIHISIQASLHIIWQTHTHRKKGVCIKKEQYFKVLPCFNTFVLLKL